MTIVYEPDPPETPLDLMIIAGSGPEPLFDAVVQDFLWESFQSLQGTRQRGGLLEFASLGRTVPWLYRFTLGTRGLVRTADGEITTVHRHIVALRILPDYLRFAERFSMLRLVEPSTEIFHPNIATNGAICVEIYPGEPLLEICQSLHDLFRWRLRQYDERDALQPEACAWGRQHIDQPIDDRPLFGQRPAFQWKTTTVERGE